MFYCSCSDVSRLDRLVACSLILYSTVHVMANMSLPEDILASLDSVESALAAFEALTGQLSELPGALKDAEVQPLEKGRVNLTVAQALNSLVRGKKSSKYFSKSTAKIDKNISRKGLCADREHRQRILDFEEVH